MLRRERVRLRRASVGVARECLTSPGRLRRAAHVRCRVGRGRRQGFSWACQSDAPGAAGTLPSRSSAGPASLAAGSAGRSARRALGVGGHSPGARLMLARSTPPGLDGRCNARRQRQQRSSARQVTPTPPGQRNASRPWAPPSCPPASITGPSVATARGPGSGQTGRVHSDAPRSTEASPATG
jgi:hypothetical protein